MNKDYDDRLITDTRVLPNQIRLIDSREGIPEMEANRLVTPAEAHRMRLETGLDLVIISPQATPPVVKLVDYGKLLYAEKKHLKELAKKQHENARGLKEFYFGVAIQMHDYEVKLNQIRKALDKKYEVRVGVKNNRDTRMALQRYQTLTDAARDENFVIRNVVRDLGDAVVASELIISDRSVFVNLRPV